MGALRRQVSALNLISYRCPLCGLSGGRQLYRHRGRIVKCLACGLVRSDPIPPPESLALIYSAPEYFKITGAGQIGYGDYYADETVFRPYFRAIFRRLGRYISPPGLLLEIGAAAGFALVEARNAGWEVEGVELSLAAASFARDRFGLSVRKGSIADVEPEGRYDVLATFQTIEHIAEVRAALRRIRLALRSRGIFLLTTPDHGSPHRHVMRRFWPAYRPEHLIYFNRRNLSRLLAEEGFNIEYAGMDEALSVPIRRLVERASHYYSRWRLDSRLLPSWRVPIILGDMLVIARRSE